jgi:hypothetical protein
MQQRFDLGKQDRVISAVLRQPWPTLDRIHQQGLMEESLDLFEGRHSSDSSNIA